jgi:hypothetical protein
MVPGTAKSDLARIARIANLDSSWMDDAACRGEDVDYFFEYDLNGIRANRVAEFCHMNCSVRAQCLEWALSVPEEFGVWGGVTPTERKRMIDSKSNNVAQISA